MSAEHGWHCTCEPCINGGAGLALASAGVTHLTSQGLAARRAKEDRGKHRDRVRAENGRAYRKRKMARCAS